MRLAIGPSYRVI